MGDFFDALTGDATKLAGVATGAASSAITSDITGYNVIPTSVLASQQAQVSAGNSQLLFLLLIGFVIWKVAK